MFNPGSSTQEPLLLTVPRVPARLSLRSLVGWRDLFSIAGRGTVVTGRVGTGTRRVRDRVTFESPDGRGHRTVVLGLEAFRRELQEKAHAGDENVGVLLKGVGPDEIGRGMALVRAGSPAAPRY